MKTSQLRFSIVLSALLAILLSACGPSYTTAPANVELMLSGEMLFEGSNSLQYDGGSQLADLAEEIGTDISQIKNVSVSNVIIALDDASRRITESLLLQVVSDNQELVTIGTLNPLPEGNQLTLSLAEDTSILPYLKDSGTTWVLDLNITEDHMDELILKGKLKLSVDYTANKK
jgi:hypothetical protein